MTVSSTSNRVVYAGNGATTAFPFAFKVDVAADLGVTYTDVTGTDFPLSPSLYTATGFGLDGGGSVTYPLVGSPIAIGTALTIQRVVSPTQPTQISNQGAMWPATIEAALDRIVMIVQGFIDGFNRSLRIGPSDGTVLNVLPNAAARANSVLGFDGAGQPYAAAIAGSLVAVASWLVANFLNAGTSAANALAALGGAGLAANNAFSGTNTFPTQSASDNSTKAATTAMVQAAIAAMGGTIAAAGSYTLPNGLILKWGTSGSIASAGNATIAFAAAFPTALFGVVLTPGANTTGYVDTELAASFKIHNSGSNSATFFWVAIGN